MRSRHSKRRGFTQVELPVACQPKHWRRPIQAAFTLVELLVVISIISILAALLMPALRNAKFSAEKTRGLNNLRQVALAIHMYAGDNKDNLPDNCPLDGSANGNHSSCAMELVFPYGVSNLLCATKLSQPAPNYYCIVDPAPVSPRFVTMCNLNLLGGISSGLKAYRHKISEVKRPSTTFLIAHNFGIASSTPVHSDQLLDGSNYGVYNPPYYNKGLMFYFVDGHMEFLLWKGTGNGNSKWWDYHPQYYTSDYPADWFSGGYLLWGP